MLRLVARGLTNRKVGETLGISPRTVQQHTLHIYEKLGVSTRAAATLFAAEHELFAIWPSPPAATRPTVTRTGPSGFAS